MNKFNVVLLKLPILYEILNEINIIIENHKKNLNPPKDLLLDRDW